MKTRKIIYDSTQILENPSDGKDKSLAIPYLVVLAGDQVGRVIRLSPGESYVLGRKKSCDIFLDDDNISREHAKVTVSPSGQGLLIDNGSTNGTRVNGKKIKSKEIQDGDRISMGNVVLKYAFKDDIEFSYQNQLYDKATKDSLTGLYNRAYFMDVLSREFHGHKRSKQPLSLLLFDIDNFKVINDTYGHISGDKVLQVFSEELLQAMRTEDLFARYGGEEFIALFSNTSKSNATQIAEKLRALTESIEFETLETVFSTSVTIGIATFFEDNFQNQDELIHAADVLLYKGKSLGKNCIVAE